MDQTLTSFRGLFRYIPMPVGDVFPPDRRGEQLPGLVARSSLRWWSSDQPRPADPLFLLVGVASWSGYDMNLLDHLDRAVASGIRPDVPVYVFDTDANPTHEALEAAIPGIGLVHHTPAVGYWDGGELVEKACGYDGRKLVALVFGLDFAALNVPITASPAAGAAPTPV